MSFERKEEGNSRIKIMKCYQSERRGGSGKIMGWGREEWRSSFSFWCKVLDNFPYTHDAILKKLSPFGLGMRVIMQIDEEIFFRKETQKFVVYPNHHHQPPLKLSFVKSNLWVGNARSQHFNVDNKKRRNLHNLALPSENREVRGRRELCI